MAPEKTATPGHEGTPQAFAETPPRAADMPAYTNQVLFEMNNTLGKIEAKIDSLAKDGDAFSKRMEALDDRVGKLEHKASFLTGVLICGVVLIPVCSGIVWWSLGERIEAALRLTDAKTTSVIEQPAN